MLAVKTVVDVLCSVPVFVEVLRGTVVGCTVVIARRKKKQRLAVFKIFSSVYIYKSVAQQQQKSTTEIIPVYLSTFSERNTYLSGTLPHITFKLWYE